MKIDVEKASSRINKFIYIFVFITIFICIIVIGLGCYEFYNSDKGDFCLKQECINYFFGFFDNIGKIFGFFVAITTILLGWLTVQIYLNTYLTTHKNNINVEMVNQKNTYLNHLKFFNQIIDNYLEESIYLTKKSLDKFILYDFVFENPQEGNFKISVKYLTLISNMNENIENLNQKLPRRLGYVGHRDFLINSLSEVGIIIPKCERRDFMKLEREIYKFLNNINKNIGCSLLNEAKYNAYE